MYWISPPEALAKDPIYGTDATVQTLLLCAAGMEAWNCAFEASKPPSPTQINMILHHAVSSLLAYLSCAPFLHGYGCFYFGITSVSNIFFCAFFYFDAFPALKVQQPGLHQALQTAFGIVFLIVRGPWWLWVTVPWWIEMVQLLSQERCHSQAAVLLYLATNLFLSYLQLKWCVQIVRAAMGLDAPDGGGEGGTAGEEKKGK